MRRHGIGWNQIQSLVDTWSAIVAQHCRSRRCRVLLVDETSMRKRHRYVTDLQDGETGQVLAMIQHRNAAALASFFVEQGPRWCRGVKVVVTDGSKSYKAAIDTHLPAARHVLDRFHVVRWFAAGRPGAPRPATPRTPRTCHPRLRPRPVPSPLRPAPTRRPPLRARPGPPRRPVRHPSSTARRLGCAPRALRALPAEDRASALDALDRFTDLYATGELGEFHDIVTTIVNWADEILDWHDCGRPSNGRIEGTNNLLQVLRRIAHGFTNADNYAARGLLVT